MVSKMTVQDTGFTMNFANGYTVSVQWGRGNYSASDDTGTYSAEVFIIPPEDPAEQPRGWQTPEQVAGILAWIATR